MHYALVFSTSKHPSGNDDAAAWLAGLADDFAFLRPLDAPSEIDLKARYLNVLARLLQIHSPV